MTAQREGIVALIGRLADDTRGAAALEYALVFALLGIAITAGAQAFGSALEALYFNFADLFA